MRRLGQVLSALGIALATLAAGVPAARAVDVRLAQEYGLSYLPLTVMRAQNLLEAQGKQRGVAITTHWLRFTGGAAMNEALISGNLDFASGGVAPLLVIWARTHGNLDVRGLSALNSMPLYLNTIDPNVHTIADFTDKDRIALPAARVSIQAIILQMAAAKAFGEAGAHKLDKLTVSMSHPDGMAAMLSGTAGITAHFTSPPYMYEELQRPNVHRVLSSYDVLGGPHTFNCIWATNRFVEKNPKVVAAFMAALGQAEAFIREHPNQAAEIYLKTQKASVLSQAEVAKILKDPDNHWTLDPHKIGVFGAFMAKQDLIPHAPASWRDVFFRSTASGLNGD
jgi:NitT/TauT family transport system substrate-binding protein